MKVAITGGAGFIGSAVASAAVEAGHSIIAFDRSLGHDVLGDLTPLLDADVVIHLAGLLGTAELFDNPEEAITVNVIGALRVLQSCEVSGAHYIGVGMPAVFSSVYTATKVCSDRLATAWHQHKGVPVSHVRAFNAFGPGQHHGPGHPQKIIPTFAHNSWRGIPLPVWGDGLQGVDLVHTSDIARMFVSAIDHGGDDATFDAGTGVSFTVNEVAAMVAAATGNDLAIDYLPMRAGEIPTHIIAEGEGWDRLDWKPEFRLSDLIDTINYYR